MNARYCGHTPARILLTSVFGPYAKDDEFGSRTLNPMELYHNQVTRTQGPFSLRMFHRTWGLMMIQSNLEAPCTVLDFPDLERFIREIREREYDIVGISSIISNVLKVRKMCELVRRYLPRAVIVVGGHIANVPDLAERIDADYIVRGEGVRWFRRFLEEDADRPLRHPIVSSAIGSRNVGVRLSERPGDVAATLIPSVGCPLGCNFCSTSAMFGGKGRFVDFYRTGDELFEVMCQLERELNARSFFVMDENFLLHRRRALRLLELMERHDKAWSLYVFSSANVLRSYGIEQLVRLGISWVWMGLEGKDSQYAKLNGIDTIALVRELQSHGICVLGSTIIGLESHTPENIDEVIEHAVQHDSDFHQFMLYTPIPGTALHAELTGRGLMKEESEYHVGDIHGQLIFNYRHPSIDDAQSAEFMVRAFDRDFEINGPSTVRIVRTRLAGWRRYKNSRERRIRRRFVGESRDLATTLSALVGATRLYYRNDARMHARTSALLGEIYREFGWKSRLYGKLGGRWVLRKIRSEERRLREGWTYEPPTFYERNEGCSNPGSAPARSTTAPCPPADSVSAPRTTRATGAHEPVVCR